ncbi:MAG: gamma-glutamyltransferase [Steroidobacteraceae bacterium]
MIFLKYRWPLVCTLMLGACAAPVAPGDRVAGVNDTASDPCRYEAETAIVPTQGARDANAPEISTGFSTKPLVQARRYLAVTANPLATQTACRILRDGGTAIDAAIATQMVLNLTEPQSSGIGGGALLLYFDAATRQVQAYDGRETAPAAAWPDYLRYENRNEAKPVLPNARESGRSVGVPGVVRMLEQAHREHGRVAWKQLFSPAIQLATQGFQISPRMAASIADSQRQLQRDPEARAYFLDAEGNAKVAGTLLRNPALADTLSRIAAKGSSAFYEGEIAQAIVDKVKHPAVLADNPRYAQVTPGLMTAEDLAGYRAKRREALCSDYRVWVICGFPPPSSGGLAVAQTLSILERFDLAALKPKQPTLHGGVPSAQAVHLIADAERLAYADRDRYVADPDFVPLPGGSANRLLDKAYLRQRAALINPQRSMGKAQAGDFGVAGGSDARPGLPETTHFSIVDRYGNAVAMTTTVEGGFGSFTQVKGFLLNNQLTDFSAVPADANGVIANRVEGGKRPRSSMAPTLVFKRKPDGSRGELAMVVGSPGGGTIIQFVVKALVGALDWNLDAQQAVSLPQFGAANGPVTSLESGHPDVDGAAGQQLQAQLEAMGHRVNRSPVSSGLSAILSVPDAKGGVLLFGGADPRRENLALGGTPDTLQ